MYQEYIEIPRLFENHIALAQCFPSMDSDRYTHIIHHLDSGIDIIRTLPWFDELVVSEGLTYVPNPGTSEKVLFDTYFVDSYLKRNDSNLLSKLTSDNRLLIILGEPGSGKTTSINYLYRHSPELTEYRAAHYIIIITCNKDYALISRNQKRRISLIEFVSIQLSESLNNLALKYECTEEEIFEDIGHRALAKGINEAMKRARGGDAEGLFEPRIFQNLLEGENYNNRVLTWFQRHHPELTIDIIIDNLDCFPRDDRNDCISKILHMCCRNNTKIVLPLRYATYTEFDHTDALYQYGESEVKLPLNSPGFKNIISKRLTRIPDKLLLSDRQAWVAKMKRINSGLCSGDIVDLFNGVFGEDVREKLKGVKTILENHYVSSFEDYKNREKVLKALMLEECYIALPKFTHIHNLFYNHDSPGFQNTLTQIRILQIVSAKDPLALENDKIISELFDANYDIRTLRNGINYLLRSNLISVKDRFGMERLPKDIANKELKLRLTSIGDYYLKVLLNDPTYISIAAQSSYIPKSITRMEEGKYVVDITRDYIRQENDVNAYLAELSKKYGINLFVSSEEFVDYISTEEKAEANNCNNTLSNHLISDKLRNAFNG